MFGCFVQIQNVENMKRNKIKGIIFFVILSIAVTLIGIGLTTVGPWIYSGTGTVISKCSGISNERHSKLDFIIAVKPDNKNLRDFDYHVQYSEYIKYDVGDKINFESVHRNYIRPNAEHENNIFIVCIVFAMVLIVIDLGYALKG